MLIDPHRERAPGLDFDVWEGNNASVARDQSPEVTKYQGICRMHSEQPNGLALELGSEEQDFRSEFTVIVQSG